MTNQQIKQGFEILREYASRCTQPNQIVCKPNGLFIKLVQESSWPQNTANTFINLLIQSNFVDCDQVFLKLTPKGFAWLNKEVDEKLVADLKEFVTANNPSDSFYRVWNIVGSKEDNPFYITGPEFYNAIKQYIPTLPPAYNQYIDQRKENNQETTRSVWCHELFLQLNDQDINLFLDRLSLILRDRSGNTELQEISLEDTVTVVDNRSPIIQMTQTASSQDIKSRKPKIFISHNHDDKEYAKQLVHLLNWIGIKNQDIFCSSYAPCGVPFGKNFLDVIRGQYDQYDLTVLFIHSPRYYDSPVSLCEMGAAWILRSETFSFLTADCEFEYLKGVIEPNTIAYHPKASSDQGNRILNEFKDNMERIFSIKSMLSQTEWETHREDFINATKTC